MNIMITKSFELMHNIYSKKSRDDNLLVQRTLECKFYDSVKEGLLKIAEDYRLIKGEEVMPCVILESRRGIILINRYSSFVGVHYFFLKDNGVSIIARQELSINGICESLRSPELRAKFSRKSADYYIN